MRIIFINLHCNGMLVKTARHFLTGTVATPKHRFLLDYLINSTNDEVGVYLNSEGTTIFKVAPKFVKSILCKLEYNLILKKNGIDKNDLKLIQKPESICQDDIVIVYQGEKDEFVDLESIKGTIVANLVHFFGEKNIADKFKELNLQYFMAESNLKKHSKIFQKNYSWFDGKCILFPFTYADRFQSNRKFSDRENRVFAVGTLTTCELPDFLEVYKDPCYQPLRRQILDNKELLLEWIDCFISKYQEKQKKKINSTDNSVVRLVKKIYNAFNNGRQKKYFSFNMVEEFNKHRFCIVPEDIQGMPGIGAFEGMACGCCMIGLNYDGYADLGLIPWKHYVPYDGSLENLIEVLKYCTNEANYQQMEQIANEGMRFIRNNFTADAVCKRFMQSLEEHIGGNK